MSSATYDDYENPSSILDKLRNSVLRLEYPGTQLLAQICLSEGGLLMEFSSCLGINEKLIKVEFEKNNMDVRTTDSEYLCKAYERLTSAYSVTTFLDILKRLEEYVVNLSTFESDKVNKLKLLIDPITRRARELKYKDDTRVVDLYITASSIFQVAGSRSSDPDFSNDAILLSKMYTGLARFEERRQQYKQS